MGKQKRTEREIQSRRGSRPSAIMEAMDQRGNSPPIYGEDKVEEEGGGPLPLSPGGAGGAGDPPRLDLPLCSLLFRILQIWPKTVSYIPGDP